MNPNQPVHPSWLDFLAKLEAVFKSVAPLISVFVPAAAPAVAIAEQVVPVADAVAHEVAG